MVEHFFTFAIYSGMIAGKDAPTVISPKAYKLRFRAAMDRYFMVAPARDSHLPALENGDTEEKDDRLLPFL